MVFNRRGFSEHIEVTANRILNIIKFCQNRHAALKSGEHIGYLGAYFFLFLFSLGVVGVVVVAVSMHVCCKTISGPCSLLESLYKVLIQTTHNYLGTTSLYLATKIRLWCEW